MLEDFGLVIGLALLPAAGNFAGGLLAEWIRPSERILNKALHAAAGIIVAVVAVEVMPEALPVLAPWALSLSFVAGGLAYIGLDAAVELWQEKKGTATAGPWMVYVAVAADLIGDGLLIGSGSAVATRLAILLAFGQVLADIPEGFATTAMFRATGASRPRRLWISASFAIPRRCSGACTPTSTRVDASGSNSGRCGSSAAHSFCSPPTSRSTQASR